MRILSACIAITIFLTASCKKTEPVTEADNGRKPYTLPPMPNFFENKTMETIYVDFLSYKQATWGTFYQIAFSAKKIAVEPGETVQIQPGELAEGGHYDIDWYSADYMITNWGQPGHKDRERLQYNAINKDTLRMYATPNNRRLICCSGDGMITAWHAVDAFRYGQTIWNDLPEHQKQVVLRLNWNYTMRDSAFDYLGNIYGARGGNYRVQDSNYLYLVKDKNEGIITTRLKKLNFPTAQSTDTLFYYKRDIFSNHDASPHGFHYNGDIYFMMVKHQKLNTLAD